MKKVVFVVIIEEIYDPIMYDNYIKQVAPIIKSYHGEYLARSNKILPFTDYKPKRAIVVGFDSLKEAHQCFESQEYEKIKHFRETSTKSKAFFIENE